MLSALLTRNSNVKRLPSSFFLSFFLYFFLSFFLSFRDCQGGPQAAPGSARLTYAKLCIFFSYSTKCQGVSSTTSLLPWSASANPSDVAQDACDSIQGPHSRTLSHVAVYGCRRTCHLTDATCAVRTAGVSTQRPLKVWLWVLNLLNLHLSLCRSRSPHQREHHGVQPAPLSTGRRKRSRGRALPRRTLREAKPP